MSKWNLIIDVAECTNCNNCLLAAKDELVGNDFAGYSRPHALQGRGVIRIDRVTRGAAPMVDAAYLPQLCNHCDDAPCIKVGGASGAVRKRPDGIVLIDPIKAKGRRDLVDACPYGAVVWNEAEQLPQHWFFDAHLLDQGAAGPRGVAVCPTQAMTAVKVDDATMAARVKAEGLRVLRPELETRPRVYYRNLARIDHLFIGGSLVAQVNGVAECVGGAQVTLRQGDAVVATCCSDAFGDFKLDGLAPGSGAYEVQIRHERGGTVVRPVNLQGESVVLGEIQLEAW